MQSPDFMLSPELMMFQKFYFYLNFDNVADYKLIFLSLLAITGLESSVCSVLWGSMASSAAAGSAPIFEHGRPSLPIVHLKMDNFLRASGLFKYSPSVPSINKILENNLKQARFDWLQVQ